MKHFESLLADTDGLKQSLFLKCLHAEICFKL